MTDTPDTSSALVDRLRMGSLLDLAENQAEESGNLPRFELPTPDQIQQLFPDLIVGDLIGSGGMGCVFRATQKKLDRIIALKVLPSELSSDALFAERFAREARAMARLNHPGIVGIHDFGSVGSVHYLILEYLDGASLRDLQNSGPIEFNEALAIVDQICHALNYAHDEGVVHRDIKPENILFDQSGRVVLADFGLARLAQDSSAPVSLTQTRQAMGTLNYMAPEQWEQPKSVDHRADIYAMGVLLYEMLTGRIPRGSFPPASTLVSIPSGVDDVIHKALQLDADDRFQSVTEFATALHKAATGRVQVPLQFGNQGTVTNFRNLGAALFDRIPRPAPTPQNTESHYAQIRVAIGFIAVALLLMALPWTESGRRGFQETTLDFMDLFDAPNSLMLIELMLVGLLCTIERSIHPIRARGICIVLLGFCITQAVFFTFETNHRHDPITAYPFIFFLLVCLFTLEMLVHSLYQIAMSMMQVYHRIEKADARRREARAVRRKENAERLQQWFHLWRGRSRD